MKSHWTPRYLFDRIREWIFQTINPDAPWLGPAAVKFLDAQLNSEFTGFEAGSGRSTVWIAKRVALLLSAEEDVLWYGRTEKSLHAAGLNNVGLHLVNSETGSFQTSYEKLLLSIEADSLDFAIVDSEHDRDMLSLALISKLRPGGFLMIDNVNWYLPSASRSPNSRTPSQGQLNDLWREFAQQTKHWRCVWTSSGVTDTAFYFKP